MDGKKILDIAEHCIKSKGQYDCRSCPVGGDMSSSCGYSPSEVKNILAVRDHVAAETRKQVIAELRECIAPFMEKTRFLSQYEDGMFRTAETVENKLDEMEESE